MLRKLYLPIALLLLEFLPCWAQYRIPLDSVAKISFISRGYILSRAYQKIEVSLEEGSWKAYRTELHTDGMKPTDDLKRTFLKDIPVTNIVDLLNIIAQSDTTIHPDLFLIDRRQIIDSVSRMYPFFQPTQKAKMIKDINDDGLFKNDLAYVIKHPTFAADETSYLIEIQTKSGMANVIHAHSFGHARFYYLPWHVGKLKNYNPELTRIFNSVTGDTSFEAWNNRSFVSTYLYHLFTRYRDRFNWDDIKRYYPDAYKLLNKNFIPETISTSPTEAAGAGLNKHYNIRFKLKNDKNNLRADFSLNINDVANVERVKLYADTLQSILKRSNFLFRYLHTRPDATALFSPTDDAEYRHYTIKSIRKFFPEIDNYSQNEIRTLDVKGSPDITSRWVLLPDNTLLLCRYLTSPKWDKAKNPLPPPFMGLDETLIKLHYENSYDVCMHFDASGTLIKDYGEKLDIYFPHF